MNSLKRALVVVAILLFVSPVTTVFAQDPIDEGDILIPVIGLRADLTSSHIEIFTNDQGQLRKRWSVPDAPFVGWRRHNLQLNIVGHNPGIFAGLTELQKGDIITLIFDETGEIRQYAVQIAYPMEVQFYRDHYSELMEGSEDKLMMLACYGDNHRWIVMAYPTEEAGSEYTGGSSQEATGAEREYTYAPRASTRYGSQDRYEGSQFRLW